MNRTIMIVDDDVEIVNLFETKLLKEGFDVCVAFDGKSAIQNIQKVKPDLLVLDVNMPKMDGWEVCKKLRSDPTTKYIPIIFLTAKNEASDRIQGFEFGADDYIVKPFNIDEVILRIKSILKRVYLLSDESFKIEKKFGVLSININKHEVKIKNKSVRLTSTEFKLLSCLIEKPGEVKSRDLLLAETLKYGDDVYSRTVDTHIQRLRSKLKDAGKYIETVRGVGYKFQENI